MANKAGRVGVRSDQVDAYGRIKKSESDTYTKTQIDSKLANKISKSVLTVGETHFYFDEKDGVFGWNENSERGADTFHPFSTGGGIEGIVTGNDSLAEGQLKPTIITFNDTGIDKIEFRKYTGAIFTDDNPVVLSLEGDNIRCAIVNLTREYSYFLKVFKNGVHTRYTMASQWNVHRSDISDNQMQFYLESYGNVGSFGVV